MRLKHDLVLIDRHESGLGIYRFRYYGDPRAYVGVMAQDAQLVRPDVVSLGSDGYLRVNYERLGLSSRPMTRGLTTMAAPEG